MQLIRQLLSLRIFWVGTILRLLIISFVEPVAANEFYIPFLNATVEAQSLNPWGEWMYGGGSDLSFPYGLAMYLILAPTFLIGDLISLPPLLSYFGTILLIELALLVLLTATMRKDIRLITILFWLSPVNLVALYFYGFNDIIPVTFLFAAVYLLYKHNWFWAGSMFALAISAKVSMVIALPVICFYFLNNFNLQAHLKTFATGFFPFVVVLQSVYIWSPEAALMLLGNPEVQKVSSFQFEIFDRNLLVIPFAYTLFVYWIWRLGRLNLDIVNALIGLVFLFFALIFSDTPGWLLWSTPFLVIYQCQQRDLSLPLIIIFSCMFVIQVLFQKPVTTSFGQVFEFSDWFAQTVLDFPLFDSLLVSFVISLGGLVGVRIWRQSIRENSFYKATRQPFTIGISGDSGAGKDTLAEAIINITGERASINISGDDYHKYDRSKGNWQAVTHLNPVANNLEKLATDIMRLKLRRPIRKRYYNHNTGKLGRLEKISARDFVIVSGLHSFSNIKLEKLFDLSIYLDMDDNLRRQFKLLRDVKIRKKGVDETLKAIEKRRTDFRKYVAPQIDKADVIFRLSTTQSLNVASQVAAQKLFLDVHISRGLDEGLFLRLLAGICQCQVTPLSELEHKNNSFRVRGYVSADTIYLAAKSAGFSNDQLFNFVPKWEGGMIGVMQLVSLILIKSSMLPVENT